MRLPQFTAESSLGKTTESYTLMPAASAEIGGVVPQGYVHTPGGLYYCYNEGGFSGCFLVHKNVNTTLM